MAKEHNDNMQWLTPDLQAKVLGKGIADAYEAYRATVKAAWEKFEASATATVKRDGFYVVNLDAETEAELITGPYVPAATDTPLFKRGSFGGTLGFAIVEAKTAKGGSKTAKHVDMSALAARSVLLGPDRKPKPEAKPDTTMPDLPAALDRRKGKGKPKVQVGA